MTGSDFASSWYGANYNLNQQQLSQYADAVAQGLEGGKGKKTSKASKTSKAPKKRGFDGMTVAELRDNAKSKGLKIPSKFSKKADIIAFLRSK